MVITVIQDLFTTWGGGGDCQVPYEAKGVHKWMIAMPDTT